MSVKGDIIASLQSALEGITKDNDYSLDVKKVFLGATSFSQAKEHAPSITIVEGNEIRLAENATNVMFAAELGITALLKTALSDSLMADINEFGADIKTVLYGTLSLGSYFLDLRILGVDNGISESLDHAYASIMVQLIYYAPKAGF